MAAPAVDFLERFPTTGGPPVWCFSVGGVSPSGPVTRRMTTLEVDKVERGFPASFRRCEHRFFGGVVEMKGLPLWARVFWRLIGGRPGDHRDWPAIESWARQIADRARPTASFGRPGGGTPAAPGG